MSIPGEYGKMLCQTQYEMDRQSTLVCFSTQNELEKGEFLVRIVKYIEKLYLAFQHFFFVYTYIRAVVDNRIVAMTIFTLFCFVHAIKSTD